MGKWKLIMDRDGSPMEIYNLDEDPLELKNLTDDPSLVSAKMELLSQLAKKTIALQLNAPPAGKGV
jgi:arylsulfatase A-like enzyme